MTRMDFSVKPFWMVFLLLLSGAVSALTLNPVIEAPDGHRLINQEPLLFNDQIIFVTEKDDDYVLWAYDLDNNSYSELHVFENSISTRFQAIDNNFYFKVKQEYSQVWRSDGTAAGTSPMGFSTNNTPFHKKGDLIFARGVNGDSLIAFDGQVPAQYFIGGQQPLANAACGFGAQDVVIPSYNKMNSYQKFLVRHQGGTLTDYSEELPTGFDIDESRVWFFENTCFYYVYFQGLSDILAIPEQGNHYFLGEQLGFSEVNYLTRSKDHYYMMADDEDHDNHIVKLSSDLSTVVKQVEFDSYGLVSLTVSDQYLIAYTRTGGNASPPAWNTRYFDEDLNEVAGLGGGFTDVPEIYLRDGGETVVFNDYINGLNQKTITTDITDKDSGLVLNGDSLSRIIVNEDVTETYVLVRELQTGENSIKKLDALPDMGSLSVGNWFDPDYKNQGMSIVEGKRDDGSFYLFVTMYLFRDGHQLWLAGTNNVNAPQKDLTITLGEYEGIGLFEPGVTPNVTVFGEVKLEMTGCHTMAATVTTADMQVFNIDLQRMANTRVNHLCKD